MGIRKILPLSCLLFMLLGGATSMAADRLPDDFGKINWKSTEADFKGYEKVKHCLKKPGASPLLAGQTNSLKYCFYKNQLSLVSMEFDTGAPANNRSPEAEAARKQLYEKLGQTIKGNLGKADGPKRITATYGGIAWQKGDTIIHLTHVNGKVTITFMWADNPLFKRLTKAGQASKKVRKAYLRIWKETKTRDRMIPAFDAWFKKNGSAFESYSIQKNGNLLLKVENGPMEIIRVHGLPRRDDETTRLRKTEQLKVKLAKQKREAHYGELVDGLTQVLEMHFDSAAWRQGFQGHCRMTQCKKKKKKKRTSAASRKACRALCDRKIATSCKRTVADVRKYIARNKKEMRRLSTELGPRFSPMIVNQLSNRLSRLMPACGKRSLTLNKLIRPVLPAPLR
ncbi:MAG: hypothetical protein JRF33_17175 [Deltaproteobacteria bacterium]|nr:hypothetical protein [Deltaproteobacteria bacterium]